LALGKLDHLKRSHDASLFQDVPMRISVSSTRAVTMRN
jgi:hypothetical protein